MPIIRFTATAVVLVAALSQTAHAQTAAPASDPRDWKIAVYPIFLWVPTGIDIHVDAAASDGSGGESSQIVDSHLDGAFFGGVAATNGVWRFEGFGMWASIGGDRPDRPSLVVDLDLIYAEAKAGRRIAPDLFITGGVRRVAFDYDIALGDRPHLSRKPGLWDPIIGIGWHRVGQRVEWHAAFEGGGFGAGADVDLGGSVRVDWKLAGHFGLAAGYNIVYLKVTDSVLGRTVTVKPTVHGPAVGFGLYF